MAGEGGRRRRRRTQGEWSELLAEQVVSGLSQRAFCEARGLSVSSFTYAKRRAKTTQDKGEQNAVSEFVPLNLENSPGSSTVASWDIELALPTGITLRIRSV